METPKHAHEGPVLLFAGPVFLSVTGLGLALIAHTTGELFVGPTLSSLLGKTTQIELHLLPTSINAPLLLSLVTIGLGIALFTQIDRLRGLIGSVLTTIGWGPDKGFDQFVAGIVGLSWRITRLLQSGKMQTYMVLTFIFTGAAVLLPGFLTDSLPAMPKMPDYRFYEWGILLIAFFGLIAVLVANTPPDSHRVSRHPGLCGRVDLHDVRRTGSVLHPVHGGDVVGRHPCSGHDQTEPVA